MYVKLDSVEACKWDNAVYHIHSPVPAGAATMLYVKRTEDTPFLGEPCHTFDESAPLVGTLLSYELVQWKL